MQVVPIVLLMILAWKYATLTGYILLTIGSLLGINFAVTVQTSLWGLIFLEGILFLPVIVSGFLLIYTAKQNNKTASP